MPIESRSDARSFWVMRAERPDGPFDVQKIHDMLVDGAIGWQAMACVVGESQWIPLIEMPGVGPKAIPVAAISAGKPPAPPSVLVSSALSSEATGTASAEHPGHFETSTKRPWNPMLIAGLGFLFTPIWAGVMAAINGKRLRSGASPWLPLCIGFGFLAVSIGVDDTFLDTPLMAWILYLGALLVLWLSVLRHQNGLFERWAREPGTRSGSWVWPTVAGVPLALLLMVAMFATPEPRQVCGKFTAARTEDQLAAVTTQNLRSSLWIFTKPFYAKGGLIRPERILFDGGLISSV